MRTAKVVIPVGDPSWDEQETSLVDVPPPSEARPPQANRTRRMDKVDPMLLALTRGRSIGPGAPAKASEVPRKIDSKPVPAEAVRGHQRHHRDAGAAADGQPADPAAAARGASVHESPVRDAGALAACPAGPSHARPRLLERGDPARGALRP